MKLQKIENNPSTHPQKKKIHDSLNSEGKFQQKKTMKNSKVIILKQKVQKQKHLYFQIENSTEFPQCNKKGKHKGSFPQQHHFPSGKEIPQILCFQTKLQPGENKMGPMLLNATLDHRIVIYMSPRKNDSQSNFPKKGASKQ